MYLQWCVIIITTVLQNPNLYQEWKSHIVIMSNRIKQMRTSLYERLIQLGTSGSWEHITTQIGMFSYTGLTERQVEHLINHYHIYMLRSGRINMCGLNKSNLDYVASAIYKTVLLFPKKKKQCIC